MACNNNSAVIDVLVENKEIPSFIRDSKDFDHSNASSLDSSSFVSGYAPHLLHIDLPILASQFG